MISIWFEATFDNVFLKKLNETESIQAQENLDHYVPKNAISDTTQTHQNIAVMANQEHLQTFRLFAQVCPSLHQFG